MSSYIITSDGISLVINGKPYHAATSHLYYDTIIDNVKHKDFDAVIRHLDLPSIVQDWVDVSPQSDVMINPVDCTISYKGEEIHNSLVDRIFVMIKEGFSIIPMTNLLKNMYKNPSKKAIDELYTFLEYGKMPITEDGYFLAYKRVNDDYTSCYDSVTKNDIGTTVSMPRHQVDDRSEHTCSTGLHICSFEYLRHYSGDRVIIVKVDPADVVSIPTDYNNTKARVSQYQVINELTREEAGLDSHSFNFSVYTDQDYDEDDEYEEDDDINDEWFNKQTIWCFPEELSDGECDEDEEGYEDNEYRVWVAELKAEKAVDFEAAMESQAEATVKAFFDVDYEAEMLAQAEAAVKAFSDVDYEAEMLAQADVDLSEQEHEEMVALLQDTLLELAVNKDQATKEVSVFFKIGYAAGYRDGSTLYWSSLGDGFNNFVIMSDISLWLSTKLIQTEVLKGYEQGFGDLKHNIVKKY